MHNILTRQKKLKNVSHKNIKIWSLFQLPLITIPIKNIKYVTHLKS